MKVIFLCPYPTGRAPSQRFRFEQYFRLLTESNIHFEVQSFTSSREWSTLYKRGFAASKIKMLIKGFASRTMLFFTLHKFDRVFIHREMAPLGPPLFEWMIARVWRKKIIYDFDDAIWLTDKTHESASMKGIRWRHKVRSICRWSYKISCGNGYLAGYAKQFNSNVFINPTTIDTRDLHIASTPDKRGKKNITIGWTGSHSTLKYLKTIVPVFQSLEKKFPQVTFLIIADDNPKLPVRNFVFRPWNIETEIADLSVIDIGVMPLPEDEWTKGKGGFKALQYMAMGIPALLSPVGVNTEIVHNGVEGYWCKTSEEWFARLEELILNPGKGIEMGKLGRKKVINHFSVASNASNFLSLFQ